MLNETLRALLIRAAASLGVEITDDAAEKFSQYGELLVEWNRVMNLTAVTEPEEIVVKHYLDSVTVIPYLDRFSCKTMIDVGTGAGFPGIPVKILRPDLELVLLDSLGKRVNFLNTVIETLGLRGIRAVHMRAEDAGRDKKLRERFDCAAARAVAPMSILLEYCMPFVKKDGHFIAMKGGTEEDSYENALKELCATISSDDTFPLPESDFTRRILCIKKTDFLSTRYPRKAGIPRKNPL